MPDRATRRRVLSQNFLVDRRAIDALVDGSGVGPGDLVLDIGAGNGLISTVLARRGARVQAIERDPGLAERLRAKFATWPSVTVVEADVLAMPWPAEPFCVVANIPFGITTKILRRLLDAAGLARADMIVQAEVARKRGTGDAAQRVLGTVVRVRHRSADPGGGVPPEATGGRGGAHRHAP